MMQNHALKNNVREMRDKMYVENENNENLKRKAEYWVLWMTWVPGICHLAEN